MSTEPTPRLVYFAQDVCDALGISRRTLERLRRHQAFPIPEIPSLDDRPRWSRAAVEAFVSGERKAGAMQLVARRRVSHGR